MKLFVWTEFNRDHDDGLAFAIAESVEEAKIMILTQRNQVEGKVSWGEVLNIHELSDKVSYSCDGSM